MAIPVGVTNQAAIAFGVPVLVRVLHGIQNKVRARRVAHGV